MNPTIISVIITVLGTTFCQNQEEIESYVKLIKQADINAETYQWPKNAFQYYSATKREEIEDYDFVIIGAGAGGCVVANRLSEVAQWKVLLLEAGPYGNNVTDIPGLIRDVELSAYNWGYNSTKQSTACLGLRNQICPFPRGKAVGGSTAINGLVYARGFKFDYDRWERISKNSRWGYESVLNYFKKSEDFHHTNPEAPYDPIYHGKGGYLRVEYHKPNSPQLEAFFQANKELGYDLVDYNANKLGVSPAQLNTIHGRRMDNAKAFLLPILNRKNLKVLPGSYVTRVVTKKGVAIGVEFTHKGQNYFVRANKEVVLSAGTIASPQLLMLSGIGPEAHLKDLNIEVVANLEVGSNLRDHAGFIGINVGTNYTEPIRPLRDYVEQYLNGAGYYSVPGNNQGVGYYKSRFGNPDIEMEFIPANASSSSDSRLSGLSNDIYEKPWHNVAQTFQIYIFNLHTISRGTLRLKSKNPFEYPLINPNYISDPDNRDMDILYDGIKLALKLLQTKAFRALDAKLQGGSLKPCKSYTYLSEEYWYCALRQLTVALHHASSTCPIGTNPKDGAVVDSDLKVFGFKNLRIADASVFPVPVAAHPNAVVVMVAEQLGDIIKKQYGILG